MNTAIQQLTEQLTALYSTYGYESYTMSKFEEYELYLRNKDFLISDRILTFTDTDGKLMALKPDVTLSIIKNTRELAGETRKMYYRENVYRPGNNGFREIMQVGLECMGQVDDYCILEVLLLAVKSLRTISPRCVLDLSHMGLLARLLDRCGLDADLQRQVTQAISAKNAHTVRALCQSCGAPWEELVELAQLSGRMDAVLPVLKRLFPEAPELLQLQQLMAALEKAGCADCINIDFSVVNDMVYYNGIVFRGFVEGVPGGVLSGGQYDALMEKMNRRAKAIGFAIYPDLLERLAQQEQREKTDAVLLYGADSDLTAVTAAVEELVGRGMTVKVLPAGARVETSAQIYRMEGNEVKGNA